MRGKKADERQAVANLPQTYQEWLQEVAPLITKEEREAFLKLEKDYQRDAFIENFWRVRDPYPDTARNELRESWSARVEEARQEFGTLDDVRARMYLLNGAPALRQVDTCGVLLWPTEAWIYPPSERVREVLVLVFYQPFGRGDWRLWMPADGVGKLFQAATPNTSAYDLIDQINNSCVRADRMAAAVSAVLNRGQLDYANLIAVSLKPIQGPSREWVSTFNSYSTDVPEGAGELPGDLTLAFPGRRQSRTVVQGTVAIPADAAGTADIAGSHSYNFLLNGEVLLRGKLFDTFRYKFDFPPRRSNPTSIPLVFERFLRPGEATP